MICATPRTGSTLLCDLLTDSGAGQPHSYLRPQDVGYWADRWDVRPARGDADPAFDRVYLTAMARAGGGGSDVIGLRLMWDSVADAIRRFDRALGGHADLATRLEQLFGPTLFIHLSREDKTAQACSLLRAQRSGLWRLNADGSDRERTAPSATDRLAPTRDRLTQADQAWSRFFAEHAIAPLRLTYETLAADPPAALASVLQALGRDPVAASRVKPRTARLHRNS